SRRGRRNGIDDTCLPIRQITCAALHLDEADPRLTRLSGLPHADRRVVAHELLVDRKLISQESDIASGLVPQPKHVEMLRVRPEISMNEEFATRRRRRNKAEAKHPRGEWPEAPFGGMMALVEECADGTVIWFRTSRHLVKGEQTIPILQAGIGRNQRIHLARV